MKKVINAFIFLFITIPIGVFLGAIFYVPKMLGQIKILHYERFPHWKKKIIIVMNHPSLLETVLVPTLLLFRQYGVRPFAYAPISTPDWNNFYRRWYWFWARPVCIPIKRGQKISEARALHLLKEKLDQNKIVVLFSEGGRTFKGKKLLESKKGEKMRELMPGIGWLVKRTGARVLPIWVKGTDGVLPNHPTKLYSGVNPRKKITIKIGQLMHFKPSLRLGGAREIVEKIQKTLLELADEE